MIIEDKDKPVPIQESYPQFYLWLNHDREVNISMDDGAEFQMVRCPLQWQYVVIGVVPA